MLLLFLILINGVSGESETVSVMEGDSVTLNSDLTEIMNKDTILWMFGPKDSLIAQVGRTDDLTKFLVPDVVAFRGRVQVNKDTGSLTIRNTRIRHSGQYKLIVSREQTRIKIFNVTVQVKKVEVAAGGFVLLKNDAEIQMDSLLLWTFGAENSLIATNATSKDQTDERFTGRVELDENTGSLTVRNFRAEDSGCYELQIMNREQTTFRRFNVTVTESSGNTTNDSVTEMDPLLKENSVNGVNEHHQTSSL